LRKFFISPEFALILCFICFRQVDSTVIDAAIKAFDNAPDILRYISLLPAFAFSLSYKESRVLLFPSEDKIGILQKWPDFKKLKACVYIGLLYQLFFSCLGLYVWIIWKQINNNILLLTLLLSVTGSFISFASFYFASNNCTEITKRENTKENN
jgi:hypothetical protein